MAPGVASPTIEAAVGGRPIRILIANNRYFVSGGPERYLFTVSRLLEEDGHVVVPFAMRYERNEPTPHDQYFTEPPLDESQIYFADRPLSPAERLKMLARVIYSPRVVADARRVIREEQIDLVYTLNIAHFLHPGVILAARAERVPVVSRLSDFYLLVPCYTMYRDRPCADCMNGTRHALVRRCMKGSIAVTAARVAAMKTHALLGVDRKVRAFACPTELMRARMIQGGHRADRVFRLPTPAAFPDAFPEPQRDDFLLFVGNILPHKGLRELLLAIDRLADARLVVAGDRETDEGRRLVRIVETGSLAGRVEFRGMVDKNELAALYATARAVVVPSLWVENQPNVLLEAVAAGVPVIAGNAGTLAESIADGRTGTLVDPTDPNALTRAITRTLSDPGRAADMARRAFAELKKVHAPEVHLRRLTALFARARVS